MRKYLISLSWHKFCAFVVSLFLLVITVFGIGYFATDGVRDTDVNAEQVVSVWNCFYFSAITFTTIGYGDLQPANSGRFIAVIESIIGIFFMWFASGLFVFKLFSPMVGIEISDKLTLKTVDGALYLTGRIRNTGYDLTNVQYRIVHVHIKDGTTILKFDTLRSDTFFTMENYWEVFVRLNPENLVHRNFVKKYSVKESYPDIRITIYVEGNDTVLSRPRFIKHTYDRSDIVEGVFKRCLDVQENKISRFHWEHFNQTTNHRVLVGKDFAPYL